MLPPRGGRGGPCVAPRTDSFGLKMAHLLTQNNSVKWLLTSTDPLTRSREFQKKLKSILVPAALIEPADTSHQSINNNTNTRAQNNSVKWLLTSTDLLTRPSAVEVWYQPELLLLDRPTPVTSQSTITTMNAGIFMNVGKWVRTNNRNNFENNIVKSAKIRQEPPPHKDIGNFHLQINSNGSNQIEIHQTVSPFIIFFVCLFVQICHFFVDWLT